MQGVPYSWEELYSIAPSIDACQRDMKLEYLPLDLSSEYGYREILVVYK